MARAPSQSSMADDLNGGRRIFLAHAAALPALYAVGAVAAISPSDEGRAVDLIAAFRSTSKLGAKGEVQGEGPASDYVGLLRPDWRSGRVQVVQAVAVETRVHGLLPHPAGGFYAIAYRPGRWLLRIAADGRIAQRIELATEPGGRTLDGHAALSPDRRWLLTTETAPAEGEGWVSVRDATTLARVAQWRTHGIEPHDVRFDGRGRLFVANGGILRAAGDRKRDLDRMDSSLVCLDFQRGELLGQWRLPDRRLSLRHLAFADVGGQQRVGIGIQAEHDEPEQRSDAPLLATLDPGATALTLPARAAMGKGYCGDIVAAPAGGFYLSCERANRVVRWDPRRPTDLQVIAEVERAGALAPWQPGNAGIGSDDAAAAQGVFIAGTNGVARWHWMDTPAMMRWPVALAPDNHWAVAPGPV